MDLVAILNQNENTNKDRLDTPALARWILALSGVVSNMTSNVSSLVDAILVLDWTARGEEFVEAYRHLLENLVSAHAFYVVPIVKMLIESFRNGTLMMISAAPLTFKV
jgi:RNA polymerase I-specific transcription initiation factor RRN3